MMTTSLTEHAEVPTRIGGLTIKGELVAREDLTIEGTFEGTIEAHGHRPFSEPPRPRPAPPPRREPKPRRSRGPRPPARRRGGGGPGFPRPPATAGCGAPAGRPPRGAALESTRR